LAIVVAFANKSLRFIVDLGHYGIKAIAILESEFILLIADTASLIAIFGFTAS